MTAATTSEPRLLDVQCLAPEGLHRMAYAEWGDAANPKVLVCVHGLSRHRQGPVQPRWDPARGRLPVV